MRAAVAFAVASLALTAAVKEVHVVERTDVLGGKPFGAAGPYERIVAKAQFAVDPKNPANTIITDVSKAPVDGDGQVEFGADVIVIKPRDPKTGNGTILFEVSNRGGTGLGMFGRGSEDYGDGFLLEQGYTIVWVGWQFDVPRDRPLKAYVPIARDGDSPIRGSVRSQFIPAERTRTMPLADRNHVAYQPVDINDDSAVMTVRAAATVAPATIPRNAWKFADNSTVTMAAGFEPAKIYEVVYTAENPPFAGLGPAGVRDFVSYLKYGGGSPPSLLNDQAQYLKRAIGFGTSQSGRFLRHSCTTASTPTRRAQGVRRRVGARGWCGAGQFQRAICAALARWTPAVQPVLSHSTCFPSLTCPKQIPRQVNAVVCSTG